MPRIRRSSVCAIVILVSASGCGSSDDTSTPAPEQPPTIAPTTTSADVFPRITFGPGWHPVERTPDGQPFRWMGTKATLVVGGRGTRILSFNAASLEIPRTLTIRSSGRVVSRVSLPRKGGRDVEVRVTGEGENLTFSAKPGEIPAAVVNPNDPRKLAVLVAKFDVRRPLGG